LLFPLTTSHPLLIAVETNDFFFVVPRTVGRPVGRPVILRFFIIGGVVVVVCVFVGFTSLVAIWRIVS
jgi:hypothetical protein